MPTIMELFKDSPQDKAVDSAANESKGGFKQGVKNFVDQELNGVRKSTLVEINNPLIYGSQATRIAQRSTPDKDDMLDAMGSEQGGGLSKVIGKAQDAVNSFLGIPETMLPSRVVKLDGSQKPIKGSGIDPIDWSEHKTNVAVTREGYGKNGTALGALLKNAGGNPSTLGKQIAGGAVSAAKDAVRGAIFGKRKDAPATDIPPAEYYGQSSEKVNALENKGKTRSKFVKDEESKVKGRMGIDAEAENPKEIKSKSKLPELATRTPSFFVTDAEDDKLQVPFWIESLNKDVKFKWGDGDLKDNRMYFRTVVGGINESITPSWEGSKFIGNPYDHYIYTGISRSVSMNLNFYCMDQNELALNWQRLEFLTRQVYPHIKDNVVNAPFIKFQLGDIYKGRIGFIESLTYTIPDNGTWEIDKNGLKLPKFIDVSTTIKLIETPGSEEKIYDFKATPKTF